MTRIISYNRKPEVRERMREREKTRPYRDRKEYRRVYWIDRPEVVDKIKARRREKRRENKDEINRKNREAYAEMKDLKKQFNLGVHRHVEDSWQPLTVPDYLK